MKSIKEALGLLREINENLSHMGHICQALQDILVILRLIVTRGEQIDGRLHLTQLWASEHLPGYPRAHAEVPQATVARARANGITE